MNSARLQLASVFGPWRWLPLLAAFAGIVLVGCGRETDSKTAEPPNPVQQRIDPVRERIMSADSIARARVRELETMEYQE